MEQYRVEQRQRELEQQLQAERIAKEEAERQVEAQRKAREEAEHKAELTRQERVRKIEAERKTKLAHQEAERKAELIRKGYIDLGLPSGTFWKKESQETPLTYHNALKKHGTAIPTKEQWIELIQNCSWVWFDRGEWIEQFGERYMISGECYYKIIGKNGNYIILKANGYLNVDVQENYVTSFGSGGIGGVQGFYLSSSSNGHSFWYLNFDSSKVECTEWEDYFKDEDRFYDELYIHLVQSI